MQYDEEISGYLNSAHMHNFIQFLEQEDKETRPGVPNSPTISSNSVSTLQKAKEKITKLRSELATAQDTISSLHLENRKLKETLQDKVKANNEKLSSLISRHDKTMESNIQYYLPRFIEKLLNEKETYINKISQLKQKNKKLNDSHAAEISKMKTKHLHDMKMLKEAMKTEENRR
jgi:DNA repair exonuclease SbcCD ATPase subunit